MITNQNDMLCSFKNGDQCFGLRGLCGLINQNLLKLEISQSSIQSSDTGSTYHIGILQNFIFSLFLQILKLLVLFFIEFTLFLLEFQQLLHLDELSLIQGAHLLMQREERDT